jgi:hypothetical protein
VCCLGEEQPGTSIGPSKGDLERLASLNRVATSEIVGCCVSGRVVTPTGKVLAETMLQSEGLRWQCEGEIK